MTIDLERPALPTPLLVAAAAIALAIAVPDERLAAQAWPGIGETPPRPMPRRSLETRAPQRCLTLRVSPGDTAGHAMPRVSGDSLVDPRMPRAGGARPPCESARKAEPLVTRLQDALQGSWSPAIPVPVIVVPQPRP